MMTLMKSGKVLPLSPALLPEKQMRALPGHFSLPTPSEI